MAGGGVFTPLILNLLKDEYAAGQRNPPGKSAWPQPHPRLSRNGFYRHSRLRRNPRPGILANPFRVVIPA